MKNLVFVFILIFFIGCKSSILDTYNAETTPSIVYNLPTDCYVKLILENSYNTVVSVLVDGQQSADIYQIKIDTKEFLEGIYFYTLTAKGINDDFYLKGTRRMILIKK